MAVLSMFYGLIVSMYYFDTQQHNLPHIHVKYQNFEGIYNIITNELIAGDLPIPKTRLVHAWIEIHKDELMANWELAINGENIFKIEPLK